MKVSVIGCGNIAATHVNALSKLNNIQLVAFVDTDFEKAEKMASEYMAEAYSDYRKMLDEIKPDSVHICTPHYLHKEMSLACLSKNINVICEKPCVILPEELPELIKAQNESDAVYGVCLQNRYNDSVKQAIKVIRAQDLGRIIGIKGNVLWKRDIKYYSDSWHGKLKLEGGGTLINQAIHTLDLMSYIVGKEPEYVTGHIFNDNFRGLIETEDTVGARLDYGDGLIGILNATTGFSTDANAEITVYMEKGEILISALDAYLKDEEGNIKKISSVQNEEIIGKAYWGSGHISLIRDFYSSIEEGEKFSIDAYEAAKVMKVIWSIYESSKSGETIKI